MWTTTSYYSYSPTAIATFKFSSLLPQIIEEEGKPFFYFIFFCYYTFHKPPYNFMWVCSMKNYISDSVRFILGSSTITIHKKNFFWAQHLFDSFIFIESIYVSTIYIWVESWPMFLLDSSSASEGYSRFFSFIQSQETKIKICNGGHIIIILY